MRCCGRGQDADYDLDLTGFDAPEVDTLLSSVHDKNVKEDDFDVEAELQKTVFIEDERCMALGTAHSNMDRVMYCASFCLALRLSLSL